MRKTFLCVVVCTCLCAAAASFPAGASGGDPVWDAEPGDTSAQGYVPYESNPADAAYLFELIDYIVMPEALVELLQRGEGGFVVVDLRREERYETAHVLGALNLPWTKGVFQSSFRDLPRDRDVYLVSEDGGYGMEAVRLMLAAGYTRVYCIEGGMQNWPYRNLLSFP